MSKRSRTKDDLLPEYDFASMKGGVRGKYVARLRKGSNIVVLEPEIAAAFPSDAAVNEALRGVLNTTKAVRRIGGLPNKALGFEDRGMVKLYSVADGYSETDLVQFSRDHLFAAETLFASDVRCLDSAGYLSHLGIELLLKALLLGATGSFPNEHSLLTLGCSVKRAIPEFALPSWYIDVLPLLDRYYDLRYPTPSTLPGIAQGDWPVIKEMATLMERYLPDAVIQSNTQDARYKAGRKIIRRRSDI